MKSAYYIKTLTLLLILCCISCGSPNQEKELIITYQQQFFTQKKGILLYREQPYTGKLLVYDAINKTHNSITYKEGKKHGKEEKRYTTHILAEQRFYTNGVKTGIHQAWWSNGSLKFRYRFNAVGAYHGTIEEWYENGQQLKAFNYEHGKESGSQKMWQVDGKLRANFVTKNGERFGLIGLKKCYAINATNETIQ